MRQEERHYQFDEEEPGMLDRKVTFIRSRYPNDDQCRTI